MRKFVLLTGLLITTVMLSAQVGIGTTTPNPNAVLDLSSSSKGLLIPRLTGLQREAIPVTPNSAGLLVYQTDTYGLPPNETSAGLHVFNGEHWISPTYNGSAVGQTLRWDGAKWTPSSNLFNQGTSIGIGTPNPKSQLHVNTLGTPYTRIQLTNNESNALTADGLVLGIFQGSTNAFINQQENRPLWFGTNGIERMRIDSLGRVGIGTNTPQATLDVQGSICIGPGGSLISGILRNTHAIMLPELNSNEVASLLLDVPGALETGVAYVSPTSSLTGIMIMYARVSAPGVIEVKVMNMGNESQSGGMIELNSAVIQ